MRPSRCRDSKSPVQIYLLYDVWYSYRPLSDIIELQAVSSAIGMVTMALPDMEMLMVWSSRLL